jgi:hypothetical protein
VNELDALVGMRADTPDDPEALARARRRLLQRAGHPRAGRARLPVTAGRRALPWAAVGGVAAAGLAVALVLAGTPVPDTLPVVSTGAPPPAGGTVSADGNILLVAAAHAESVAPVDGRYWLDQTQYGAVYEVGPADDPYRVVDRQRSDSWIAQEPGVEGWFIGQSLGARPLTPADTAAWQRDGAPDSWSDPRSIDGGSGAPSLSTNERPPFGNRTGNGEEIVAIGGRNATQQDLDALPADPGQLREVLLRDWYDGGGGGLPTDVDHWLFVVGSNIIHMPVRPEVRGAAYRMLDALPGVRDLGAVQDVEGRAGQAVAITEQSRDGTHERRLVIDPATGEALSTEHRVVRPDGSTELIYTELVLSIGSTDESPPEVREHR